MDTVFVPKQNQNHWDTYWSKTDYQRELNLCETDGLVPIFNRHLQKKGMVVEAGCGMGKWVVYLGREKYNIIGLDNNEYALKKLREYNSRVKTEFASVENLPFKDNSLDGYISLGVVEHIEHGPQKALKEAYRTLKPGGTAIIEVPYDNLQRRILRYVGLVKTFIKLPIKLLVEKTGLRKSRDVIQREFYEYHYTKQEMKSFIEGAGFEIQKWYAKDDIDPTKSIGLWLDFPRLRSNTQIADFKLTNAGIRLKKIYKILHLQWMYSACIVCIAVKK